MPPTSPSRPGAVTALRQPEVGIDDGAACRAAPPVPARRPPRRRGRHGQDDRLVVADLDSAVAAGEAQAADAVGRRRRSPRSRAFSRMSAPCRRRQCKRRIDEAVGRARASRSAAGRRLRRGRRFRAAPATAAAPRPPRRWYSAPRPPAAPRSGDRECSGSSRQSATVAVGAGARQRASRSGNRASRVPGMRRRAEKSHQGTRPAPGRTVQRSPVFEIDERETRRAPVPSGDRRRRSAAGRR